MAETFSAGEVCFAKVKGYPPWPAIVREVMPGSKYNMYFYGTKEHALVPSKEMQKASQENIAKIATENVKKRKWYSEGLNEMLAVMNSEAKTQMDGSKSTEEPNDKPVKSSEETSMNPVVLIERSDVVLSPLKRPVDETNTDSSSKRQKTDNESVKEAKKTNPSPAKTLTEDPYKRVMSSVPPSRRLLERMTKDDQSDESAKAAACKASLTAGNDKKSSNNAVTAGKSKIPSPVPPTKSAIRRLTSRPIENSRKTVDLPQKASSRQSLGTAVKALAKRKSLAAAPSPRLPRKSMGSKGQVRKSIDSLLRKSVGENGIEKLRAGRLRRSEPSTTNSEKKTEPKGPKAKQSGKPTKISPAQAKKPAKTDSQNLSGKKSTRASANNGTEKLVDAVFEPVVSSTQRKGNNATNRVPENSVPAGAAEDSASIGSSNDNVKIKIGRVEFANIEIELNPRSLEQIMMSFPAFAAAACSNE